MVQKTLHNKHRYKKRQSYIPTRSLGMSRGFTIVELLIVIVVIAILATITIISYNGITKLAKESSLKSDLRTGATALEIVRIESGKYPADQASVDLKQS